MKYTVFMAVKKETTITNNINHFLSKYLFVLSVVNRFIFYYIFKKLLTRKSPVWPLTPAKVPRELLVAVPFSLGMDQIERTRVT